MLRIVFRGIYRYSLGMFPFIVFYVGQMWADVGREQMEQMDDARWEQMDGERGADGREQMETGADGKRQKIPMEISKSLPPL